LDLAPSALIAGFASLTAPLHWANDIASDPAGIWLSAGRRYHAMHIRYNSCRESSISSPGWMLTRLGFA